MNYRVLLLLGGSLIAAISPACAQYEGQIAMIEQRRRVAMQQHEAENRRLLQDHAARKRLLQDQIEAIQADLRHHATFCDYQQALRRGDRNFDGTQHFQHVRQQQNQLNNYFRQISLMSAPVMLPFNGSEFDFEIARVRREAEAARFRENAEKSRQAWTELGNAATRAVQSAVAQAGASRPRPAPAPVPAPTYTGDWQPTAPAAGVSSITSFGSTLGDGFGGLRGSEAPTPTDPGESSPGAVPGIAAPEAAFSGPANPLLERIWTMLGEGRSVFDAAMEAAGAGLSEKVDAVEAVLDDAGDRLVLSERVMGTFDAAMRAGVAGDAGRMGRASEEAGRAADSYAGRAADRAKSVVPGSRLPDATRRFREAVDEVFNPSPRNPKP